MSFADSFFWDWKMMRGKDDTGEKQGKMLRDNLSRAFLADLGQPSLGGNLLLSSRRRAWR